MKTDMKPEIKPDSSISEETLNPAAENMTEWRSTSRKSEENEAIYTAAEISLSSSDIMKPEVKNCPPSHFNMCGQYNHSGGCILENTNPSAGFLFSKIILGSYFG